MPSNTNLEQGPQAGEAVPSKDEGFGWEATKAPTAWLNCASRMGDFLSEQKLEEGPRERNEAEAG
jgi:hypothetical protein